MSRPTEKLRLLTERVLDDDIAFDILTRLPVKSLIRFRCVSKSWYSTITNPIFIATHFKLNEAKSLSNKNSHNGYLLYTSVTEGYSFHEDLRTLVYNRDRTVTEISRFITPFPFCDAFMNCFCNGIFCLDRFDENNGDHMIYLWNPSIRKFKMLAPALLTAPFDCATLGLAYHSQKNDFKILRLVSFPGSLGEPDPLTEAEVYTLSTDSWRKVVISVDSSEPNIGYVYHTSPFIFFNGALHCIASTNNGRFILSFEVNDERFHKIMLPQDSLDGYQGCLGVFKGLLAFTVLSSDIDPICDIWVMKEYGLVESWTRKSVPIDWIHSLFGVTDNGELFGNATELNLIDPEKNLNQNILVSKRYIRWVGYASNFMESLVLLDGGKCIV
ncbi:F-box/kelch-repeat protein At3g06240-like [Quercus lobata]|uniref:F-box/kelch-repeat protein At3g06240-like n=1 Tax=Quercus lobata TaxID=97700 RepID=UPI0012471541|nr:F-box/kelch-repeat protein At3g06240-like [Quercus lobata]